MINHNIRDHCKNINFNGESSTIDVMWVKAWNKEPWNVWIVLKNYFFKFWKITTGTLYIKIKIEIEISYILSKLQLQNFHENSPCFKNHFIYLKHSKKNMWTCGFFVSNVFFPYPIFTKLFQFFLWTLIYSTRRDPCVQNIQKINIHIPFHILIFKHL
jgi:hypothetical protein